MIIQDVVDRLTAIIEQARSERSRAGYFAALYRRMTQEIQSGIDNGEFNDPVLVERLDVAFADRYFVAYDAWRRGQPTTSVWQAAFSAAADRQHLVLQHLLLGINAHINLDLGIVTATMVEDGELSSIKRDFDQVNLLIRRLIPQIQDCINRLSLGFRLVDSLGGSLDETLFDFSLQAARDSAWDFACELQPLSLAARGPRCEARDREFTRFASHILRPGLVQEAALCAAHSIEEKDVVRVIDGLRI
jgi:Family of unknown function (DUF5995)